MSNSLEKITTEYSQVEDRLVIKGSITGGGFCAIFLTQRLMSQLMLHMTKWLESDSKLAGSNPSKEKDIKNWLQGGAQEEAVSATPQQEPVEVSKNSESWLAHEIDITQEPSGIRLAFKSPSGNRVDLGLNKETARQWLNIIYKVWQLAEWTLAPWPQWITGSEKQSSAIDLPLH